MLVHGQFMIKYSRPYLGDVNLLDLQVIQHIGHGLKPHELLRTDVLLTLRDAETQVGKDETMS
jgi:hypothetical protein